MKSPKYSFQGTGKAFLISLGLSLLGAFATWIATINTEFDFGAYAPLIGALAPILANTIKEFIQEKK
jgi:hypothetical protein